MGGSIWRVGIHMGGGLLWGGSILGIPMEGVNMGGSIWGGVHIRNPYGVHMGGVCYGVGSIVGGSHMGGAIGGNP